MTSAQSLQHLNFSDEIAWELYHFMRWGGRYCSDGPHQIIGRRRLWDNLRDDDSYFDGDGYEQVIRGKNYYREFAKYVETILAAA